MKCNKCNSEWSSSIQAEKCPFCGAILNQKPESFSDIKEALKYLVERHGKGIYKKPAIVVAYLSDIAPELKKERKLLK